MIDSHRRRIDKLDREKVFLADNAADFPAASAIATRKPKSVKPRL